ncbi:acetyl xylan esterase [Opitutaceae bacterium TAV5]|nr:acetyl xylan esterase [Opitutaceae bacterium TAV5]
MKTAFSFQILIAALAWATVLSAATPKGREATRALSVRAEQATALYEPGQPVTFVIRLTDAGTPVDGEQVTWTLSKDGVAPVRTGIATVAKGEARVTGTLDEPGFLQCRVESPASLGKGKNVTALAGAGISPRLIRPSLPAPVDFDAFWDEQKAELAGVPANLRLSPAAEASPVAGVELLDVQADCAGGTLVSGYLARPAGAKPRSLPAILTLHGAGVKGAMRNVAAGWAKDGLLALDINAHGLPNGKPESFYQALAKGEFEDYRLRGRESRETVYFRGMFLRVVRALDVLAAQPEWDGKHLVIYGTSQGGAQAIAGAALDPRVTFLVAGVPAMCDHSGMVAGRVAGWPKLVPVTLATDAGKPGIPDPAVLAAARYYDMVNFAARIRAPAQFTVGFIDRTCPPTTVYAAFNAVPGTKAIFDDIGAGHENTPEAKQRMRAAVRAHAGLIRK